MTITTDTTLLHDPRRQAALLYWQGFSVPQIAAMLQMKRPTVQSWKQRDGWDSVAPISRVEMSLEARLTQLIIKPQKTGGDFKEIDLLGRQIERLARVNRYSQTGNEADLNAFLEKRYSTTGKVIRLETSPAKYTRRGVEEDVYWWVPSFNEPTAFAPGSVFHLLEPDINQELYGLPEYLSALNSAWLNESATLFRRKYYENGAHAGYIMYVTDAVQDRNDIEMLRENMVKSKGRNNFKNLFLYAPQGKADGIKIIPLSEVATKDDFFNIKKASAADLLDAHRIPFQLMGGKPENVGSLGDIEKVAKVFVRNELIPLQDRIREINGWLGQEVIRFKNYSLDTDNG